MSPLVVEQARQALATGVAAEFCSGRGAPAPLLAGGRRRVRFTARRGLPRGRRHAGGNARGPFGIQSAHDRDHRRRRARARARRRQRRRRAGRAHPGARPRRLRAAHAPAQHGAVSRRARDPARRRRCRRRAPGGVSRRLSPSRRVPRRGTALDLADPHRHQPGARPAARAPARPGRGLPRRARAGQRRSAGADDGPSPGRIARRRRDAGRDATPARTQDRRAAARLSHRLRPARGRGADDRRGRRVPRHSGGDGANARLPRPGAASLRRLPKRSTSRPAMSSPSPARAATGSSPACSSGWPRSTPPAATCRSSAARAQRGAGPRPGTAGRGRASNPPRIVRNFKGRP